MPKIKWFNSRNQLFNAVWLLFASLSAFRAGAQLPGIAFSHYTTDDGLPHDFIWSMTLDREGFLWAGTIDGLARFDGQRFETFRHNDSVPNSLPDNVIAGLSCDPQGRLWIGTERGLAWFDAATRNFHSIPIWPPGASQEYHRLVTALSFERSASPGGQLAWFGIDDYLVRLNLQTLEMQYYANPAGYTGICYTYIDRHNRIWMALDSHTFRFDPANGTFHCYMGRRYPDPALAVATGSMNEDESGRLWVCSWGRGLFYFDEAADRFVDYPDDTAISSTFVFDQLPGDVPVIWIGEGAYGVYILDRRDGTQYQFPRQPLEKYAHNGTRVRCIVRDTASRNIWLGTDVGLEKYDPHDLKFARVWLPDALKYNQFCAISGIVQDPRDPDRHWISVWGVGLYEWRRRSNQFRYFGEHYGVYTNEIFTVTPARGDKLWLAELHGIELFDPATGRTVRRYKDFLRAPGINHKILSLLEGRDGQVWVGCNYEGLFCLDPVSGRYRQVELPGVKDSRTGILALFEGPQGQIYASTSSGLYRCRPGETRATKIRDGASGDMTLDQQQRLWVASRDGAWCFDADDRLVDSLNTRNTHGVLRNNAVYLLTTDRDGNIWVGTANGLYRFNPLTREVAVFTKNDGLFSNEISNALESLPNGDLFVAFGYNFNLLNPKEIPVNPRPPKVVLTGLKIANEERPWTLGLPVVLQPGEDLVTFDFSALNFTQPDETVLIHRLVGFEEGWVETSLNTPITYTNLDGGEYVLQVKARNGDGVESVAPYELRLRVIPPFYQTAWFRFLLALALVALVSFVFWYREQERRRLDRIRRRIARDLHDDMGSTLSSIQFFSEVAQNRLAASPEETRPLLRRIADSAGTLSDAVRDIVWAIGGKNDQLDDLVTRMREFGLRICEARNIAFLTDLQDELPQRSLRPDQLRNFYLVFKEAVNNAAKYAECSQITFRLRVRRGFLTLEIADNGRGFEPETALSSGGNGLSNLQHRAAEIDGKITLQSAPGRGTRVVLTAPLG